MVDLVLRRMQDLLSEWDTSQDRRAVFLDCYVRMTAAMTTELEEDRFEDSEWVARLLDRFAWYYFDAVERWELGDTTTPRPWQLAFDAARDGSAGVSNLLLAGVNAHINYDLVLTMLDLLDPVWGRLDERTLAVRRADFDRVNVVIAATADEVQDAVLERRVPWLGAVDVVMGRADEWLATRLLRSWRDDVWRASVALLDARDEAGRSVVLARRCERCERRARRILGTG